MPRFPVLGQGRKTNLAAAILQLRLLGRGTLYASNHRSYRRYILAGSPAEARKPARNSTDGSVASIASRELPLTTLIYSRIVPENGVYRQKNHGVDITKTVW